MTAMVATRVRARPRARVGARVRGHGSVTLAMTVALKLTRDMALTLRKIER